MFRIHVISLLPEVVQPAHSFGVVGRAVQRGLVSVQHSSPRQFAEDVHRTVDDRPYGGGPGMVLKYQPMKAAIEAARRALPPGSRTVLLSAQGNRFDQSCAARLSAAAGLLLIAGRYEGIDERISLGEVDEEISIGDFVMSGGELAAAVVIDAVARLLPGVLGDEESARQDSFAAGLLDCPHYTRPEEVDGMKVPAVLAGGDHQAIQRWRLKQALGRTWLRRPDLLRGRPLSHQERDLLDEFRREYGAGDESRTDKYAQS